MFGFIFNIERCCSICIDMLQDECAKAFETLLHQSGKFGCYQKRLYAIVSLMQIVCCSILMYMKFIPPLNQRQSCSNLFTPFSNESEMFLTVNDSVTFGVTCAVYYENELNLESDWILPEVSYCRANQE